MAVSHDVTTDGGTFTTTNPFTFVHTPVGVPRTAVVMITQLDDVPRILSVSYGGVALADSFDSADDAGEPGTAYIYSNDAATPVPAGPRTVSITHDGNAVVKHVVCATVLGTGDVHVFNGLPGGGADAANPSLDLQTDPSHPAIGYAAFYSGLDAVASIAEGPGQTRIASVDFGTAVGVYSVSDTPSALTLMSWVSAADDVAIAGMSFAQFTQAATAPSAFRNAAAYFRRMRPRGR